MIPARELYKHTRYDLDIYLGVLAFECDEHPSYQYAAALQGLNDKDEENP